MEESVLIPTGTQMKSYACMRSLHRRGIRTIVASERSRIPHFSSRYCDERINLTAPPEDVLDYKNALVKIARRPDVQTIMPVRETDVYVFAKYREEFEDHVSLVTPDLETLQSAHDRLNLAKEAVEAGVPVADTRRLSEVEAWDRDVVIKSRYNLLTGDYVDSYPMDSIEEMKRVEFVPADTEPDIDGLPDAMKHEPIVQDFVPQEKKHLYTALWKDGEPLATYQHRQIRQNSWVGGGGVYRKSVHSRAVEETAYDLLSHLDWHGYACIEYVKDARTGEWKFLEINPRIWQSITEALRAGADFPYYYWQTLKGEEDQIDLEYEAGQACHIAYGEVAHLMSILRDDSPFIERPSFTGTLFDIVTSSIRHPRFDYIRRDDPRLFLSALRETMAAGITPDREYEGGSGAIRGSPGQNTGTR